MYIRLLLFGNIQSGGGQRKGSCKCFRFGKTQVSFQHTLGQSSGYSYMNIRRRSLPSADGHRRELIQVDCPAQRPLQPRHRPAVAVGHVGADHDALPLAVDPHRQGGRVEVEQQALRHAQAA